MILTDADIAKCMDFYDMSSPEKQRKMCEEAVRRVANLEELILGVIQRCQPMGYVGVDGQYIKQLRASIENSPNGQ